MMVKRNNQYNPNYAIVPGMVLEEYLESINMSQSELSLRTSLSKKTINEIIQGKNPITPTTALKFEKVLGRPANFWNNLEINYQEDKARAEERASLVADLEWLSHIPTKELLDRGCIQPVTKGDKIALLQVTLSFFGVASVNAWKKQWEHPAIAARCSQTSITNYYVLASWVRQGEIQASRLKLNPFNRDVFEQVLKEIRNFTSNSPEEFTIKMRELCAASGVAVAFVPEMKKAPWNGATKWISPHKALIILSLRGKSEDKFWFTFFHEAYHVLKGEGKTKLYINSGQMENESDRRANEFASSFLIPKMYHQRLIKLKSYNELKQLAHELNISQGIVAGQVQYLTNRFDVFHRAIRKFEWETYNCHPSSIPS